VRYTLRNLGCLSDEKMLLCFSLEREHLVVNTEMGQPWFCSLHGNVGTRALDLRGKLEFFRVIDGSKFELLEVSKE